METNHTAESILELNQPFAEFMQQFPSEKEALEYYRSYVAREQSTLQNEAAEVTCRITWKKFMSRKRRTVLDYLIRYYLPSTGWRDLSFQTTHRLSRATFRELRLKLVAGRIGRIVCIAGAFVSICLIGSVGMFLYTARADLQEDPEIIRFAVYVMIGFSVLMIASLITYPKFRMLSQPEKLSHISRGYFVVDRVKKV